MTYAIRRRRTLANQSKKEIHAELGLSVMALRVLVYPAEVFFMNYTAKDIMNPNVMTVRDDMTLHELATFLTENEISGSPVLDRRGKLIGVVSVTDIALSEAERASIETDPASPGFYSGGLRERVRREDLAGLHLENNGLLVRDIMTPAVYTVPDTASVSEIAKTMITGRLHRLLVIRGHQVVGIITTLDLIKLLV
jgi:CBS domain-containing protein